MPGGGYAYTFNNELLNMQATLSNPQPKQQGVTGPSEPFCAGQHWAADGRRLVTGSKRQYALIQGNIRPTTSTGGPA